MILQLHTQKPKEVKSAPRFEPLSHPSFLPNPTIPNPSPPSLNLHSAPPIPFPFPQHQTPTMPADEYSSVVRGGLKLKGSAPSGVSKKKKKDKKPKAADGESESKKDALRKALEDEDSAIVKARAKGEGEGEEEGDGELEERGNDGKTASERAYEEMRRKRLHERLQKEGVRTHKEKVEELNKYLSNLSEHHDMPRIGPG